MSVDLAKSLKNSCKGFLSISKALSVWLIYLINLSLRCSAALAIAVLEGAGGPEGQLGSVVPRLHLTSVSRQLIEAPGGVEKVISQQEEVGWRGAVDAVSCWQSDAEPPAAPCDHLKATLKQEATVEAACCD